MNENAPSELAIVEKIRKLAQRGPRIALGPGDDCAIYRPRAGDDLLFKIDPMIEDVHFRRTQPPALIGQRALGRNLSDIAAMGGDPRFCLVSLAIPPELGERWIDSFYRGLMSLARRTGTALAGGHLARAPKIYCDVIVCGSAPRGKALLRTGARPGDDLYVSGRLGKSWEIPIRPRLEMGRALRGVATSCIDISDGISLDLFRLAKASGLAAELDRVPVARGSTLERALHGGEDYELIFTIPLGKRAPRGSIRIGRMVRGKPGAVFFNGQPLDRRGHDHFRVAAARHR
jgi:thiamine-monophosphate kinase